MDRVQNFENRTLKQVTLKNGMKCCFVNDMNQEDVAFRLSVGGGSESEPKVNSGIANFTLDLLFTGSMMYPGHRNFKEFIIDNEVSCYSCNCATEVFLSATIPEFALREFLQRVLDAFENPEFSIEGSQYVINKRHSDFFQTMRDDRCRLGQIAMITMSGDKSFAQSDEELFQKKNLQLLVREYHSKFFKPSNVSVVIVSSLPEDQQYNYVAESLGLLTGTFQPQKTFRELAWNHSCQDDELILTKAFTMNPIRILVVKYILPVEATISSSLYLEYLFVKSDSGSLNYCLKSEGLITNISSEEIIWKNSLRTLQITIEQTEEGLEQTERILNILMAYLDLIKNTSPSEAIFDEANHYFQNLRAHEEVPDNVERIHALSRHCELVTSIDDILFPNIPRCFDPANITKTLEALKTSNLLVTALSNKYVHTRMHPGTDIYLQYSQQLVKIVPCATKLVSPKPSTIAVINENFVTETKDIDWANHNLVLFAKSVAAASRAILRMKIHVNDFTAYSPAIQELYASVINYKMWLLGVENIFSTKIRADNNSLVVEINSVPTALPGVFSVLISYLRTPIGNDHLNELLRLKSKRIKHYENFLYGDETVDQDLYTEAFLEKSHDVRSMIAALKSVNLVEDLPCKVEGSVTILLGGRFSNEIVSDVHGISKNLEEEEDLLESNRSSHIEEYTGSRESGHLQNVLAGPLTIETNKNYSVCLKSIDLGRFSYPNWCQAVLIAEILNTVIPDEMRIRTNHTANFTAKVTHMSGRIGILVKASHRIPGSALARKLSNCVLEYMEDYLNPFSELLLINSRAKCANIVLTRKENLQCEMTRLWIPIDHGLPLRDYFTKFQECLWQVSPVDMTGICSRIFTEETIHNAPTCLFLSAADTKMSQILLSNIELPLLSLYRPISNFRHYLSATEAAGDDSLHTKQTYTQNAEKEQDLHASQLEEANRTASVLALLTKMYGN